METSSRMVDVMSLDTQMVVALSAPLCPGPSFPVCCGPGRGGAGVTSASGAWGAGKSHGPAQ